MNNPSSGIPKIEQTFAVTSGVLLSGVSNCLIIVPLAVHEGTYSSGQTQNPLYSNIFDKASNYDPTRAKLEFETGILEETNELFR